MADLGAIVFVRGKSREEIVELAKENEIALLLTKDTMYTASGKLYSKGLQGLMNKDIFRN